MRQIGLEVDEIAAGAAPNAGAYQVVIAEGAVNEVPAAWTAALGEGGRLAVILRDGPMGKVRIYAKADGRIVWHEAFDVAAPFLPGFEPKAQFAF
jgi:protein-L-isoaspartate(D-aspartate) O-methyltransferase